MDEPLIDYRQIQQRLEQDKRQPEDDNRDSLFLSLGKMALLLGGAYVGLKHFPSELRYKMADRAERWIAKLNTKYPELSRYLPQLKSAEDVTPLLARAGQAGASPAHYSNLHLAEDMATMMRELSSGSGFSQSKDVIVGGFLSRYMRYSPPSQNLRYLTLGDILGNTSLASAVDKHSQLQEFVADVKGNWGKLKKMPGFQKTLSEMKLSEADFPAHVTLGKGLVASESGKFYNAQRFLFPNMMDWITSPRVNLPFVGAFHPLRLFNVGEFKREGPAFANLSEGYAKGLYTGGEDIESVLYAGGYLIPKSKGGKVGRPFAQGFKLAKSASLVGQGAEYAHGITPRAKTHLQYFLDQGIIDEKGKQALESVVSRGGILGLDDVQNVANAPLDWVGRMKVRAALLGERIGIGPQFATNKSQVFDIYDGLRARSRGTPEITKPFRDEVAIPLYGRGPASAGYGRMTEALFNTTAFPKTTKDLTFWEKLQLAIGKEPKRWVKKTTSSGREKKHLETVAKFMKDGVEQLPEQEFRQKGIGKYVAYQGSAWTKFVNAHLNRPFWLLEQMLGINVRPGRNAVTSAAKIAAMGMGVQALSEGADYVEYKMNRLGVENRGPISAPVKTYMGARLLLNRAMEVSGITAGASYLEDKYPGLLESPLSKGVRAGASLYAGIAFGGPASIPLGISLAALNMTDLTQKSEDLQATYSGEKLVPVRRGRWWMLGRQSFEGEKISHFRPHLLASALQPYKDENRYGGAQEKWAHGTILPTPESWFGLKKLLDPYYIERMNYEKRPYPVTSPYFENIPLVGPAVSSTLGRLLKPTKRMHTEHLTSDGTAEWLPEPQGIMDAHMMDAIGMTPYPVQQITPVLKERMSVMTGAQIHKLFQWSGLPGFMLTTMKEAVTGSPYSGDTRAQMASSGMIANQTRDYYDRDLGGLAGYTEFARRFVPKDRRIPRVNNIPNTMPDWLPGSRSKFETDRDNFVDFHTGDAYIKTKFGDAMLPGQGYEALARLHSGIPGVYDPMDRLRILANIAPSSEAFEHYKTIVSGWQQAGVLDRYWNDKYFDSLKMAEARLESPFKSRRFTAHTEKKQVTISEVIGPTRFKTADGGSYDIEGVNPDINATINAKRKLGINAGTVTKQYGELARRLQDMVGTTVQIHSTGRGFDKGTPAYIPGLSDWAANAGMFMDGADGPLAAKARYGNSMTGKMWEHLTHLRLPGPLNWPLGKFFSQYDPLEQYQSRVVEGADFAGWDSPYQNFLLPWTRQTINFITGDPRIPQKLRMRRDIDEYFDNLKYMKYRRLEEHAKSIGSEEAANFFRAERTGTMSALQYAGGNALSNTFKSIPRTERAYFKDFSKATSPSERAQILAMSPPTMANIYKRAWNDEGPRPEMYLGPTQMQQVQKTNKQMDPTLQADQYVVNNLMRRGVPSADWMGWHPDVSMESVKVRSIASEGYDVHKFGMWESELQSAEAAFPQVQPISLSSIDFDSTRQVLSDSRMRDMDYWLASPGSRMLNITSRRQHGRKQKRSFRQSVNNAQVGSIF